MAENMAENTTVGPVGRIYRVLRVVVLLVLVAAILLVFRKSPPPVVDTAPDAAETLKAKLVEEQKNADAKQPHALKLNEGELNSLLASGLQLAPTKTPAAAEGQSSVRDVKIGLLDDRVRAYVVFVFHGQELSLQLEGQPGVADGYLRFSPMAGKLGSLPLPQLALNKAVERMLDAPDNKEKFRVPAEISDIRVEGGELVVSYR